MVGMKKVLTTAATVVALAAIPLLSAVPMVAYDQPWPDYPAWLTAVATLAAFIAAVLAVRFAGGAFTLESKREERWKDGQRSAQAALIAAWWGETVTGTRTQASRQIPIRTDCLLARNASDVPVTNVVLELYFHGHLLGEHPVAILPPSTEAQAIKLSDAGWEAVGRAQSDALDTRDEDEDAEYPTIAISFRDAAGVTWRRSADGQLSERP